MAVALFHFKMLLNVLGIQAFGSAYPSLIEGKAVPTIPSTIVRKDILLFDHAFQRSILLKFLNIVIYCLDKDPSNTKDETREVHMTFNLLLGHLRQMCQLQIQ